MGQGKNWNADGRKSAELALCLGLKALLGDDCTLVGTLTDQTGLVVSGNLKGQDFSIGCNLDQFGLKMYLHTRSKSVV